MESSRPEDAADLVSYEVQMLRFTFESLRERRDLDHDSPGDPYAESCEIEGSGDPEDYVAGTGPPYDPETWVYLESFLLHARCIRDFLDKKEGRKDDVLASEYYDDQSQWQPSLVVTQARYLVDDYQKVRLDKALAHISHRRLEFSETGKSWDVGIIYAELMRAWTHFLSCLSEEKRAWFWRASHSIDDRS